MPYSPLASKRWRRLVQLAKQAGALSIAELCQAPGRLARYSLEVDGLYADFTRHLVTDGIMDALRALAEEAGVMALFKALAAGETVNLSEDRPALHVALRSPGLGVSASLRQSFQAERQQLMETAKALREGAWRGETGKPITDVVNIGIGGSHLGPKMACAALRSYAGPGPRVHFIANVDGAEIRRLLAQLLPESTLFVLSSKSFTTSETLANAATALDWLGQGLGLAKPAASRHVLAVTASPEKAAAYGVPPSQTLTFHEGVGGRYSLWSATGLPLAIAIGSDAYGDLLAGAAAMDSHFLEAGAASLPMALGLLRVWYNNCLGWRTQAVVPYCERLGLLVAHLQQLDMESNGKSAGIDGKPVGVATGPVIWGQTGTNGQHAFFQWLHQGTQAAPVDFIGACKDDASLPEHHRQLNASMIAQADALMAGQPAPGSHRHYPGNRPSSLLLLETLSPRHLGLLIALYEHVVFVQGALWGINSFDQWGVELGKQLAGQILAGEASASPATQELRRRTGL